MKKTGKTVLLLLIVLSITVSVHLAFTQNSAKRFPILRGPVHQINKHFITQAITYNDGVTIERNMINGPRIPPIGYEHERKSTSRPEPNLSLAVNSLEVPAYKWVFGCSAVSGAMIAGYYDRNGFVKIYEGSTDGGVIPLTEDPEWEYWMDDSGDEYPDNPLVASHQGLDGRGAYGSIDDYWVSYSSKKIDPYIGQWNEHGWGDAIGDFMKTSQSDYGNNDGWTMFYWNTSGNPLTCSDMETLEIDNGFYISDIDGTYGRKLFYEAKGYEVTDCYSQLTDNVSRRGFSFEQFMEEIDAGRPVFINLVGHSIVGVGYDASSKDIYIHDTWDNDTHTMRWGGSYAGMKLRSVSIVNIRQRVAGPNISVFPASHDFGSIGLDTPSSEIFTISNTGSEALTIDNITLSGDNDFVFGDGTCSGGLESSSSCTVEVTFIPSSDGLKSADLIISSNDPDEPEVNIALTGSGLDNQGKPDLSGSWGELTKERKGKSAYKIYGTFTITSTVPVAVVEVKYYFSDDDSFDNDDQLFLTESLSINSGSAESAIVYNAGKTDPGGKYLIARIDPSDQIDEEIEDNNDVFGVIP